MLPILKACNAHNFQFLPLNCYRWRLARKEQLKRCPSGQSHDTYVKGDTDASILDGVKIIQKK
jgi:hypothetical protein